MFAVSIIATTATDMNLNVACDEGKRKRHPEAREGSMVQCGVDLFRYRGKTSELYT